MAEVTGGERSNTDRLVLAYEAMGYLLRDLERTTKGYEYGLCNTIDYYGPIEATSGHMLVFEYAPSWEHYSGDRAYPVPDDLERETRNPERAYTERVIDGTLWVGEQRKLRISLLKHIMRQVELELAARRYGAEPDND